MDRFWETVFKKLLKRGSYFEHFWKRNDWVISRLAFNVNKRNVRAMYDIRSKLRIKTQERRHWPLLTLNKQMSTGSLLYWSSRPFNCSLQLPSVHRLGHGCFAWKTSKLILILQTSESSSFRTSGLQVFYKIHLLILEIHRKATAAVSLF